MRVIDLGEDGAGVCLFVWLGLFFKWYNGVLTFQNSPKIASIS